LAWDAGFEGTVVVYVQPVPDGFVCDVDHVVGVGDVVCTDGVYNVLTFAGGVECVFCSDVVVVPVDFVGVCHCSLFVRGLVGCFLEMLSR